MLYVVGVPHLFQQGAARSKCTRVLCVCTEPAREAACGFLRRRKVVNVKITYPCVLVEIPGCPDLFSNSQFDAPGVDGAGSGAPACSSAGATACKANSGGQERPERVTASPTFKDIAKEVGLTGSHITAPEAHYRSDSTNGGVGLFDCDNY